MTLTEKHRYSNIRQWYYNDILYCLREPSKDSKYLTIYQGDIVKNEIPVTGIYKFRVLPGKKIICACINPERALLISDNGDSEDLDYMLHLTGKTVGENLFYVLATINGELGYAEFDLRQIRVNRFWKAPFSINAMSLVSNDVFYVYKNSKIACYLLDEKATQKWLIDLTEMFNAVSTVVSGIIQFENKLFALCCMQSRLPDFFTLCLDAHTGEVIEKLDISVPLHSFGDKHYFAKMNALSVLDPTDYSITKFDFEEQFAEVLGREDYVRISPWKFQVTDSELLFFVDGGPMPKNRWGIVDIKTGKLLQMETYSNKVVVSTLQVIDNKVFIGTSDNVLRVYEYEY